MGREIGSTKAWRARAEDDPWFAVASHVGKQGKAWNRDEFYSLGDSDFSDFLAQWQRYARPSGTCLEVGCGAGRLTKPLARFFERVIATDVSETMIGLAREVVPTADFRRVDGVEIPLDDQSVDCVFTAHVLQHFEAIDDVVGVLQESRRVLRPGGTIMAHMLLRTSVDTTALGFAREFKRDLVRKVRPGTTARRYSQDVVRRMFDASGFVNVQLNEFCVRSNNDPHPFWFGTAN